jgi:hypothetical protein
MSHDSVDEGAEIRACESGAEIARCWRRHRGGCGDLVAQFWFVAASSLSIPRRGAGGRTAFGAVRGHRHANCQDAGWNGQRPARPFGPVGRERQRDRTTGRIGLPVGNARAWGSGRDIGALSISNMHSIVCSPSNSRRPTRFSIPIGCAFLAPARK